MINFIILVLFTIFFLLSLLHFYWAFGGKWGSEGVYPSNADGSPMRPPGFLMTIIVAIGLLLFGVYYLIKGKFILAELPFWTDKNGLWILTVIFILRAAGDFKYFGFFKRIKSTKFGINDTKYYSPLSLIIGTLTLILGLNI